MSHLSDQVQNLRVRLLGVERAEDVQRDIHKRLHGVVEATEAALQEMTDTLPTRGREQKVSCWTHFTIPAL